MSAPGSIAGIAIVFGEFVVSFLGESAGAPQIWGIIAVAVFAGINLMGIVKLRASRAIRLQDMVDGASLNTTILGRDSPT